MAIIMTDSKYYGEIAEAIRAKNGTSNTYMPSEMGIAIEAIESGGSGGDGNNEDLIELIEGTLETIKNNDVSIVGRFAFYSRNNLVSLNFPACSHVGVNAFQYCENLESVNIPNCAEISKDAFYSCGLRSANFPNCTYIRSSAFANCKRLTSISFPNCTYIGSSAFNGCSTLGNAVFPNSTYVGSRAFQMCYNLKLAHFSTSYIGSQAFQNCSRLASFINVYSSVAQLYNRSAFYSTPMSKSTYTDTNGSTIGWGSIYVPASLVNKYKTATNWASYAARITNYEQFGQINKSKLAINSTETIAIELKNFDSTKDYNFSVNIAKVEGQEDIILCEIINWQRVGDSLEITLTTKDTPGTAYLLAYITDGIGGAYCSSDVYELIIE